MLQATEPRWLARKDGTCFRCGKPKPKQNGKYCSIECTFPNGRKTRTCARRGCENVFVPAKRSNHHQAFCSYDCWKLDVTQKRTAICPVCNVTFLKAHSKIVFCSKKCNGESIRKQYVFNCVECGIEVSVAFGRRNTAKFCSQRCMGNNQRGKYGPLSNRWENGSSFHNQYPSIFDDEFKKRIRKRDKYTCVLCSKAPSLNIHHINYNKQDTFEWNCITLCTQCHARTNGNRSYWQEFLAWEVEKVCHLVGND